MSPRDHDEEAERALEVFLQRQRLAAALLAEPVPAPFDPDESSAQVPHASTTLFRRAVRRDHGGCRPGRWACMWCCDPESVWELVDAGCKLIPPRRLTAPTIGIFAAFLLLGGMVAGSWWRGAVNLDFLAAFAVAAFSLLLAAGYELHREFARRRRAV